MAQRRILRSLAATAVLRCLAVGLAHAKESRSVPRRAGDGTSDARETAIDLTVPEEAVIHHGHVVRCSLPFAHQDGAGSRKRCCGRPGRAGGAVTKCARKQPVEFLGDRPGEPSIEPFLPRVSNGEGKNVTPQGRWWLVAELPLPQCPQFCPRQFFEYFKVDVHNRLVKHGGVLSMARRHRREGAPDHAERFDRFTVGRSAIVLVMPPCWPAWLCARHFWPRCDRPAPPRSSRTRASGRASCAPRRQRTPAPNAVATRFPS